MSYKYSYLAIILNSLIFSPYLLADELSAKLHNIQQKRLTAPTKHQVHYEKQGKVYVYIGIKDKIVDKIMDANFDRIENFTFFSTISTDKNERPLRDKHGELILESDDC